MAKSKRNLSRKHKQSRKLTQKGTKRNRKLKRGKLVGGYNTKSFIEKFEALGLPNLGADVDSEISKRIEDNNSIKDFLTNRTKSAIVSGKLYKDLTGYEKYCIENATRLPNEFKFKPPGLLSSFLSYAPGSTHPDGSDKEAFYKYKQELSESIEKFIDDFAGKKSAILELFDVLDEEATADTDNFRGDEIGVLPVSNEANRQKLIDKFNAELIKNTDSQTKEDGN